MRVHTSVFVCFVLGVAACGGGGDNPGDDTDTPDSRPVRCGDNVCDASELNSCSADCGLPGCDHDTICEDGESTANCASDCVMVTCNNNGVCDAGETPTSCPGDCMMTGTCDFDFICDAGEMGDPNCFDCLFNC